MSCSLYSAWCCESSNRQLGDDKQNRLVSVVMNETKKKKKKINEIEIQATSILTFSSLCIIFSDHVYLITFGSCIPWYLKYGDNVLFCSVWVCLFASFHSLSTKKLNNHISEFQSRFDFVHIFQWNIHR